MEVGGGEAGDGVGRQGGFHARAMRPGALGVKRGGAARGERGGEGAAVVDEEGLEAGLFMDDHGAGGEVAEAFVLAVADHGDDAGEVEAGQDVNEADEVAGEGFEEGDLAAGVFDDAELHDAFAGGLAVPEGFKESEVSPEEKEMDKDDEGDQPLSGGVEFIIGVAGGFSADGFGEEINAE